MFLIKQDGLKHTIYESTAEDESLEKETRAIIVEVNKYLKADLPLERFKRIQKIDPFKTGTQEDRQLCRMLVTLILVESKKRYSELN